MSAILDALRKRDATRRPRAVPPPAPAGPPVPESPPPPAPRAPGRTRDHGLPWVLALTSLSAAAVLLGLAAFLVIRLPRYLRSTLDAATPRTLTQASGPASSSADHQAAAVPTALMVMPPAIPVVAEKERTTPGVTPDMLAQAVRDAVTAALAERAALDAPAADSRSRRAREPVEVEEEGASQPPEPIRVEAPRFAGRVVPLKLTMTMPGERPLATVNGQIVTVGDVVDGYAVQEIGADFIRVSGWPDRISLGPLQSP